MLTCESKSVATNLLSVPFITVKLMSYEKEFINWQHLTVCGNDDGCFISLPERTINRYTGNNCCFI